jgi:hypothetical protein
LDKSGITPGVGGKAPGIGPPPSTVIVLIPRDNSPIGLPPGVTPLSPGAPGGSYVPGGIGGNPGGGPGGKGDTPPSGPAGKGNPNCITNAVAGGILGTKRGLIAVNGKTAHDGIHIYAPPGAEALVTALPAMAGRILHTGRQSTIDFPQDYRLGIMDIQLNIPIKGQTYVMTLKDMTYSSMQKGGNVRPGKIGFVTGSVETQDESGLHVTLMPKSIYDMYIGNSPTGAKRNNVPFNALMDAARDPASPFKCP